MFDSLKKFFTRPPAGDAPAPKSAQPTPAESKRPAPAAPKPSQAPASRPAPPAPGPRPAQSAPVPAPATATTPASAPGLKSQSEGRSTDDQLVLPIKAIVARIPAELMPLVKSTNGNLALPLLRVLEQLPQGSVRFSLPELRDAAPPGTFGDVSAYSATLIDLPLQTVLSLLGPSVFARRAPVKQLSVPAEVGDLFGSKGEALTARATPATSRFNRPVAPATPPVPPTPPTPKPAAPAGAPTTPGPVPGLPRPTPPSLGAPTVPKALTPTPPTAPAGPIKPSTALPTPPAAQPKAAAPSGPVSPITSGPTAGVSGAKLPAPPAPKSPSMPVAPTGLPKPPTAPTPPSPRTPSPPLPLPKPLSMSGAAAQPAPAMPKPALPSPPSVPGLPKPAGPAVSGTPPTAPAQPKPTFPSAPAGPVPALSIAVIEISGGWSQAIRDEIAAAGREQALVALPADLIDRGLRGGRLLFTWKQIGEWLKPEPVSGSPNAEEVVEVPLAVIAPRYLAQFKPARQQKKIVIGENIPDVFGPQSTKAASPAPVPVAPEAVTAPVPAPDVAPSPAPTTPVAVEVPVPTRVPAPALPVTPTPPVAPKPAAPAPPAVHPLAELLGHPGRPTLSFTDIVKGTAALRGVTGAVLGSSDGLLVAAELPATVSGETVAAFLPQMLGRIDHYSAELQAGTLTSITLAFGDVSWQVFRAGGLCLAVLGRPGENLPAAQLATIAAELGRQTR